MVIKMRKKILLFIIIVFVTLSTTGCWNYRGLNEMTIVAGTAIDKYDDHYKLSFEVYDLQSTGVGQPIKTKIIESTGKTIFDAVRNAKKRASNKLYFAQSKIIIVSQRIAKEDGINSIIDWFSRDPELRETLEVVVSQEKSASAILKADKVTSTTVSQDIQNIVDKDQLITSSTEKKPVYKIYNVLNSEGVSLTLPAIHITNNNEKDVCEVNGIAVFKEDKFVNYLSSEDTKYYLLAKGMLDGGIITINTKLNADETELQNVSFEIISSKSSQKYTSQDENDLRIKVTTNTEVVLGELKDRNHKITSTDITKLEKQAGEIVKERIEDVITKIQTRYETDILGYGKLLHSKNPKKWKEIKNVFNEKFINIKVEVESEIKILNTGFTR